MPYSYTLSAVIPASPAEIYQAWLDSILHSEMTGGEADMTEEVGADVSAWDGYIMGRILELVPGERIVQSWRTTEFEDAFEDSIVTILLQEAEDGTLLTLEHSNVPDEHKGYEQGGWQSNYFEPMIAYLGALRGGALLEPEPEAPISNVGVAAGAGRRHDASAGPQRRAPSRAREAKPAAAKGKPAAAKEKSPAAAKKKPAAAAKKKPAARAKAGKTAKARKAVKARKAAKNVKKATRAPVKRAAKKSSAKTSTRSPARRGAAKKAARAAASRRKSTRSRCR